MRKYYITTVLFFIVLMAGISGYFSDSFIKSIARVWETKPLKVEGSFNQDMKRLIGEIDNEINSNTGFRLQFVELHGAVQKYTGNSIVKDADKTVVKLKNNKLSFYYFSVEKEKLDWESQQLSKLSQFTNRMGIPLLYLQAPFKIEKNSEQLPEGLSDYINEDVDYFLKKLSTDTQVDYVDLRELMKIKKLEYDAAFFNTDHHWKPETAFWAYTQIAHIIKDKYGFVIPEKVLSLKNYNIKEYKNYFLGSEGKRVGRYYGGVDDFSLIYPKFHTDLEFKIPSKNLTKKGTYLQTVIDHNSLGVKDYYNKNPYAAYTGGDYPLNIIINRQAPNQKKVLLVRDSYSCPFAAFLSMGVNELHIIDLRHYNKSLLNYIKKEKPDLVLFLYYPTRLNDFDTFQFN